MWRGLAKGVLLTAFGRMPGGPSAYSAVTRGWMGTQVTHVDKLRRVWPEYVRAWRSYAGLELDGADVWVHEGGWTPFPFFANHLVTGRAGVVTNREGRLLDRYLAAAVNGAVSCELPSTSERATRLAELEPLRWSATARDAVEAMGGRYLEGVDPGSIAIPDASIDLCHSGGALEHLRPETLAGFLRECRRILRPGGVMSHVFDHRDPLHHADAGWAFLAHLRLPPWAYTVLCGHRLLFHNRLLPSQVASTFERAGFERIAVRRMLLPSHRYVDTEEEALAGDPGIERAYLARCFRQASDADLRTAAAHYLYRKPA